MKNLILASSLGLIWASCAPDTAEPAFDQGRPSVAERQEALGGATMLPSAEAVGVVKLTSTFASGSGAVWRSWKAASGQGSYVITARHVLSQADELTPSGITVKMGTQTARGVYAKRYSSADVDIAIIRVYPALKVNGSYAYTRTLYSEDYNQLPNGPTALSCYGYGITGPGMNNFGTLRWAWFYASGYTGSPNEILLLRSYDGRYFATLESGDSGGPCLDTSSRMVSTMVLGVPAPVGGGNTVAMDSAVRAWLTANSR